MSCTSSKDYNRGYDLSIEAVVGRGALAWIGLENEHIGRKSGWRRYWCAPIAWVKVEKVGVGR